tara:strand:+ start:1600 stop:2493 length:894 start_codon:yes stop_codon:yes gene_type:complete
MSQHLKNRMASALVALRTKQLSVKALLVDYLIKQIEEHEVKKDVAPWLESMNQQYGQWLPESVEKAIVESSSQGLLGRLFSPEKIEGSTVDAYRHEVTEALLNASPEGFKPISSLIFTFITELGSNPLKKAEDSPTDIDRIESPFDVHTQWHEWWMDTIALYFALRHAIASLQSSIEMLSGDIYVSSKKSITINNRRFDRDDDDFEDWFWLYLLYSETFDYSPHSYDSYAVYEELSDDLRALEPEVTVYDDEQRRFSHDAEPYSSDDSPILGGSGDGDVGIAAAAAIASGGDLGSFS